MKAAPLFSLLIVSLVAATPAAAGTVNTLICKRDLAKTWESLQAALKRLDGLADMPQEQKCAAISGQGDAARNAREVWSRCHAGEEHDRKISDADDVIEAVRKKYNEVCPPRPGMVRVNMVSSKHIAPRELLKPLAAVHTCAADPVMKFMNEPFDGGRIMLAGCKGRDDVSADEVRHLNASAQTLAKEQVVVYLALDSTGRGAVPLSFPILTADGNQISVDTLPEQGTIPMSRNTIAANWAPADPAICRIHAEWRVTDRKARLVLWQELAECKTGEKPEFKTVLDRRQ